MSDARDTTDTLIRSVVDGLGGTTGVAFFETLVRELAGTLGVAYAFVTEFAEGSDRFRSVACWGRGQPIDNFEVPLAGTPCESVLCGRPAHHPDRLIELFPTDVGLVTWGVVSYAGVPIREPGGRVCGHLAVLHEVPMPDATGTLAVLETFAARTQAEIERVHADAALRSSEARYRDLYQDAPLSYMTFTVDGIVTGWNARARELTGCTDAELDGARCLDLMVDSPETVALFARMSQEVFVEGRTMIGEVESLRRGSGSYWARCTVAPLRDAAGRIVGARSLADDITDRKRAEQALRDSEARLAGVIDSAMDAIITIEADGRCVLFNRAAEEIFRCRAADVLGASLDRFLTPAGRETFEADLRALAGAGTRSLLSRKGLTARRADGEVFEFEGTLSRVDLDGRSLFTVILRDVEARRQAEAEQRYLQEEIQATHNFGEIIGQSPALAHALRQVDLVAGTDSTVLILGETGSGKELVARAIHARSPRKARPLIKVNCAALPTGLIESELFGHEKGSFTGATDRRIGRFELAHRGTLFLDEVGELPLDLQSKLLRVLQEHELERVGGNTTVTVDVRLIAATNRDLPRMVADGTFRQDLFYRLNVFPVRLPALRERPEDVALLVHYFLRRYAAKIGRPIERVAPVAMARLAAYPWPGNVRELENVVERAVILSPGSELEVPAEMVPTATGVAVASPAPVPPAPTAATVRDPAVPERAAPSGSLEDVERGHIVSVLELTNWKIEGAAGAAAVLGLSPSTLRSRMQRLGIRRGVVTPA